MEKRFELAKKQGLNWQALLIEETQTKIKLVIKEELLKGSNFAKINSIIVKMVDELIKELENEQLKIITRQSILTFATRCYMYLQRTLSGLSFTVLGAIYGVISGSPKVEDVRIVNKLMENTGVKGAYTRALPLDIYAKDYMKQVAERLDYLAEIEAKEDYSSRVTLRNIAEMQIRQERHEKEIQSLIENGENLVWIQPHANCSERCQPWQGRLYSLDNTYGEIDGIKYEPLDNAMNVYQTTKSGKIYKNGCISGFNCRHKLIPYKNKNVPVEIPASIISEERAINNKQRYLERGIRIWKERALLYKNIDNEKYVNAREKAKQWNRKYIDYSKEKEVAYYPSRTDII